MIDFGEHQDNETATSDGPFPERAHIIALVHGFMALYSDALHRWSQWALDETAAGPTPLPTNTNSNKHDSPDPGRRLQRKRRSIKARSDNPGTSSPAAERRPARLLAADYRQRARRAGCDTPARRAVPQLDGGAGLAASTIDRRLSTVCRPGPIARLGGAQ